MEWTVASFYKFNMRMFIFAFPIVFKCSCVREDAFGVLNTIDKQLNQYLSIRGITQWI